MSRLQESVTGKVISAVLLLVLTFSGALCALQALSLYPFVDSSDWTQTRRFRQLLEDRNGEVAYCFQLRERLTEDQDMSYIQRQQLEKVLEQLEARLEGANTLYRFQVKSADGQEVLTSNLEEGQTLEQAAPDGVYYDSFTLLEDGYSLASDHGMDTEEFQYYVTSSTAAEREDIQAEETFKITAQAAPAVYVIESGVADTGDAADEFAQLRHQYVNARDSFPNLSFTGAALLALALVCLAYQLWTCGHKAGEEGIVTTWQEHIFFDLYLAFMLVAGTGAFATAYWLGEHYVRYQAYYQYQYQLSEAQQLLPLVMAGSAGLWAVSMGTAALTLRTLAVRLKAHRLAHTTLLCRVVTWCWRSACALIQSLPFLWKVIAAFVLYFFADLILFDWGQYSALAVLMWWLLNLLVLFLLCWWSICFHRLRKGSQAIAAGNLSHQIDTHRFPHDLRCHAEDLNNLSQGLSSAVEEKMKSERFKAELITNVSHDLKTPLTSIINYVNLLRTTQQTDPKAVEYIDVLDRKSQRLKKLTEDLVEASKASTGVLSVNREKIGMAQLIDQALGEWDEKLQARKLTLVTTLPEGETWVYADGRHLWRVIDNLLSNCAKYAMEGTRVYLDLTRGKGQVSFSVKNISREPLNIPPERLMERFVRGEESRTTEGSGLGLSIARSLTELQGGTFELAVDGDLFKAIVTLPQSG